MRRLKESLRDASPRTKRNFNLALRETGRLGGGSSSEPMPTFYEVDWKHLSIDDLVWFGKYNSIGIVFKIYAQHLQFDVVILGGPDKGKLFKYLDFDKKKKEWKMQTLERHTRDSHRQHSFPGIIVAGLTFEQIKQLIDKTKDDNAFLRYKAILCACQAPKTPKQQSRCVLL